MLKKSEKLIAEKGERLVVGISNSVKNPHQKGITAKHNARPVEAAMERKNTKGFKSH